ncbi:MAG: glycine zipper 2TM domain-containing protein [Pseudomonadota bacterium]|nr:glycine zipper 2TM domain-containing protein [Polaromonas sp.]MDP2008419.1 glycine zipper 2TM domain-containing protein [Rubrivivax sp.]
MSTSRFFKITSSVLLVAGLAACAAPMTQQQPVATYPAQNYPAQSPQGNYVEYGRVNNVEVVQAQDRAKPTGGLGMVLGGVAGAVVGRQIGGGSGRDIATVVGAVGGAVAGNAIEANRNAANAPVNQTYRVSVQMDNGTMRAYEVPSYGELRIGDRVRIQNNQLFRM